MAGRHPVPPHAVIPHLRHPLIDDHRVLPHHHYHQASAIAAAEEHLAAQYREIQALLIDNQRLAATHVALRQEFDAAQHELRLVAAAADKARAARDAELHDILSRAARAEADARVVEAMRLELSQVRTDVQRLGASRDELVERLQKNKMELSRAREKIEQSNTVREELEIMQHELQRGRAAVDYEKKVHADNLEQSHAMEKNMISLTQEVEKLRAELANAHKRARATAAAAATSAPVNPSPGYQVAHGTTTIGYGDTPYAAVYGIQQPESSINSTSHYVSGGVSSVPAGSRYMSGGFSGAAASSTAHYAPGATSGTATNSQYVSQAPHGQYDIYRAQGQQ